MVNVTIKTSDGKVYTDPKKIHIPRNESTKSFYKIVDAYIPDKNKKPIHNVSAEGRENLYKI